jgi:hypothetical protein
MRWECNHRTVMSPPRHRASTCTLSKTSMTHHSKATDEDVSQADTVSVHASMEHHNGRLLYLPSSRHLRTDTTSVAPARRQSASRDRGRPPSRVPSPRIEISVGVAALRRVSTQQTRRAGSGQWRFRGNADLCGLGIRLGVSLQWVSSGGHASLSGAFLRDDWRVCCALDHRYPGPRPDQVDRLLELRG